MRSAVWQMCLFSAAIWPPARSAAAAAHPQLNKRLEENSSSASPISECNASKSERMPRGDELLLRHLDARVTGNDVILRLNAFFEGFFAVENSVTLEQWNSALPTPQEKVEITQLINLLYALDTFAAVDALEIMLRFPTLSHSVVLTILDEGRYCVIHEPIPCSARVGRLQCRLFPRFFGYAVIQARRRAERLVHHSAAHFQSDGNVCNQSAVLFERTASRSLVVAGASRYAVVGHNPSPCQPKFQVADAAHNNATMFHVMNVAVHRAAKKYAKKRSVPFEDAFIQWHGMAETSCQSAPIFISTGAPGTDPVYQNQSSPVQKLYVAVNALAKGEVAAQTPFTDGTCKLVATTNLFGRVVNGVRPDQVCHHNAKTTNVRSQFISVEQKRKQRNDWSMWIAALLDALPEIISQ